MNRVLGTTKRKQNMTAKRHAASAKVEPQGAQFTKRQGVSMLPQSATGQGPKATDPSGDLAAKFRFDATDGFAGQASHDSMKFSEKGLVGYAAQLRRPIFEVIVRQAMSNQATSNNNEWRHSCAVYMRTLGIMPEEVEAEVYRRNHRHFS